MQFKNFKSLASTHIKKSILLLVISSMSALMLCSCGNNEDSASIETDVTEATTQTPTESTSEQTELENQDKDPTEATTQQTTQSTTQETTTAPTTQTQTTESTNPTHVHTWTTETYYTTETQTVHHDAVTHQETVTTYTTETQIIHHDATDGDYYCGGCGAHFTSESAASDHCANGSDECFCAGYSGHGGSPAWDETVEVQVPHTETVTVVDTPAWDETVEVQVPHTRTVCSECGAKQ